MPTSQTSIQPARLGSTQARTVILGDTHGKRTAKVYMTRCTTRAHTHTNTLKEYRAWKFADRCELGKQYMTISNVSYEGHQIAGC